MTVVIGDIIQTSYPLTKTQMKAWTKHVLAEYPKEACAYIVNGRIFPVQNVHAEPNEHFSVSVMDRFEANKGKITGFLHSHCGTSKDLGLRTWPAAWPSSADLKGWMADDTRWGISSCEGETVTEPIWLDENYIAPLEGRPFIGGIWDCYTAVRDWMRVNKGITIKNYPRGVDMWVDTFDMYDRNFADAGFVEIEAKDTQPGDAILFKINSKMPIHAAIIIDGLTMYHQLNSPLLDTVSGITDQGRWAPHVYKYARYEGPK